MNNDCLISMDSVCWLPACPFPHLTVIYSKGPGGEMLTEETPQVLGSAYLVFEVK